MFSSENWFGASAGFYNGVITSSCRFNGTSSKLVSPAFGSDLGNTWTWSAWVKFTNQTSDRRGSLFNAVGESASLYFDNTSQDFLSVNNDGSAVRSTSRLLRDPSSWYHIVLNGNGTLNKLWINGVLATFDTNPNVDGINIAVAHQIGGSTFGANYLFDGIMADINFVSETALDYTAFAEEKNGVLIPKEPSVTYGANGFRLQFKQTGSGADASGIGADTSGNNKHFTATGLDAYDVLPDSPENNFATFNGLITTNSGSLSEGNLKSNSVVGGGSKYGTNGSTFLLKSGKWYAEMLMIGGSSIGATFSGAVTYRNDSSTRIGFDIAIVYSTSIYSNGGVVQSGLSGISAGDVFGFAVDVDNKTCQVYKNGSTYGSQIDWSGNTYADNGFTGLGHGHGSSLSNSTIAVNYGQDSTFAGNKTSGSENAQDANEIGDFYDTVPSGFLALCSANLPEPTISPNETTQADDHFNTVLYSGNGSGQSITGVGFQPDWVWAKERSSGSSHQWYDSSRGVTNRLESDNTGDEDVIDGVTSFDTDGFTIGTHSAINDNGITNVAWNWKANGGTTTTNDASATNIGSIDSVIQANTTAGFSIVTYTGTGSAGTVAHGVQVNGVATAPKMLIVRNRTEDYNWKVYHAGNTSAPETDYLVLDTTDATADNITHWADTEPSETVFSLGTSNALIKNNNNFVAYCFAEVEGYSKFGSYTGNGSTDGTFVYTGFRPAWIMVKRSNTTGNWIIQDSARDTSNVGERWLFADSATSEATGSSRYYDFVSNGIKFRNGGTGVNNSGSTYIYMAFAESPFKYANAR